MAKFVATDYNSPSAAPISAPSRFSRIALRSMTLNNRVRCIVTHRVGGLNRYTHARLPPVSLRRPWMQPFNRCSVQVLQCHQADDSAVGATNPTYSFNCCTQYTPFASSVGDLATLSVTWPGGDITAPRPGLESAMNKVALRVD